MIPVQIPVGSECRAALETSHNGTVVHLVAQARVAYSILNGTEGFRTGLQFTNIDAANNKILAELMI